MKPPYRELYFGMSDSRNEASDSHESFIKSYVDLNNVSVSIREGTKFLVLGPKGAGKSALAWYLNASESEGTHLATVRDASELPLAEVPHVQTGQPMGPDRTVAAWKFILLCNYLEVLLRDQSCSLQQDKELQRVAGLLRGFGLLGDTSSGRVAYRTLTTTLSIPIPKLGTIYQRERRNEIRIYNLIPYLEEWVSEADSRIRHVLLIDGLDSIFLNDEKYDESLSSLVQAAYQINQRLRQRRATGSIVLLLRNDVFARISLSLPDSQKMRDDLSIDLDWRILSGPAGTNDPLMRLVNKKAAKARDLEAVQVLDYFPNKIEVGRRGKTPRKIGTFSYLLNMTRHTPRDLLRLFEEVRRIEDADLYPAGGDTLSLDVIHEGVLQYASRYFVGAIRNEFAGYEGGPESASAALTALKSIGKQNFTRPEFTEALAGVESSTTTDPDQLLRLLFFAGAIGNYVDHKHESYMQFYHRRDDTEIYLKGNFILHHALIHAWSMRRTKNGQRESPTGEGRAASSPRASRRRRRRTRSGRSVSGGPVSGRDSQPAGSDAVMDPEADVSRSPEQQPD